MKKHLLFAIFALTCASIFAQPTTHSVMPAIGTVYSLNSVSGAIVHAAGGNGQTWNFNPLANSVTLTYSIIPLSATSATDQATFPAANYFRLKSVGSMTVGLDFLHIQSDRLIELGEKGSGGNYNMKPVPYTTYTFAMNVGSTHVSTYTTPVGTTTRTVKCDGTGTLTTPFGTFNNALRLKTYNIGELDTLFSYYDTQPTMRLQLHYVRKGDNSITNKFVYDYNYSPTLVNEIIQGDHTLSVFPNPTSGVFNIQGIEVNSHDRIFVYNSLMQKCYELELTTTQISLEDLPPGIYFIELRSKNGIKTQKVLKQ